MASSERSLKKDKNQNIQVFVRLRPLNSRERAIRSIGVVEVVNGREVVVRQSPQTSHTKKFTFDKAFAPTAQQVEVYREVVSPLIAEVLAGYNCTVFAYGQTGTGKTHTMVGESSPENTTWQEDPLAGIIPRALSQLFDELRVSRAEYTVRVSYLELYNEELFDLLSSAEDNSKLRIYEDVARKGSTIVNGLEEITVYNKNEVYQIMAQGQERKKVASTLMNAQSSNHPKYPNGHSEPRSHTVFTIVVHMKENCPKGEELVKIGKLNLVDLAGSENISKAGSDNPGKKERARECVNINQSLLTLGRVITALVEKHPHIPYRESKLTRILQESLGGRTKTSIIATISPGHKDLEETMSTLEYAHRAKNIQNKPEVNQKLTKQAILKEFAEEVDKLKRELTAAREKNGVYLSTDMYDEMTTKSEEQRQEIQELLLKKRALEEERERLQTVFGELERAHERAQADLGETRAQLHSTAAELEETASRRREAEHLVSRHVATESSLTAQARAIMAAAQQAASDARELHNTVDRRKNVESSNKDTVLCYRDQSTAVRGRMLDQLDQFGDQFGGLRQLLQAACDDHTRDMSLSQEATIQDARLLQARLDHFVNEIKTLTTETTDQLSSALTECDSKLESSRLARRQALEGLLAMVVQTVGSGVDRAEAVGVSDTVATSTQQWLSGAVERVSCLQRVHSMFSGAALGAAGRRGEAARGLAARRAGQRRARDQAVQDTIQEIENDKKAIEDRMASHLAMIESEREETETRLRDWMERERRSLEERMARHVEDERNALNVRIERHMCELEKQRQLYAESAARIIELQEVQLQLTRDEMEADQRHEESCAAECSESTARVHEYTKEFEEGTLAITAEMEAFSSSVVQIVEHTTGQLLRQLRDSRQEVQKATEEVSSKDLESSEQYTRCTREAVTAAIDSATTALTTVLHKTQEATSTASETLSTLSSRTSSSEAASQAHQATVTATLGSAGELASEVTSGLREQIAGHEDMEGRYLMREYRVYSPTGNTPMRREYRYPRRLVQTSPHARILARLRAQRANGAVDSPQAQDIVVVEDDDGRHTSDSDEVSESSGVSEDSAVAMR